MNLRNNMILAVAIIVGACGGGGSGTSAPPGGGNGGGNGGGPADPAPNGSGEIVFPWTHSSATSPTITVRGIAADPEGVASVSVNGTAATIVATASAGSGPLFAKTGLAEGEVEWSAELELENGANALVISVEDEEGDVTEDVAMATINYGEVPIPFTIDPDGTRFVGLSYTLGSSGYEQKLVQHDYATDEQVIFEGFPEWTAATAPCLRASENDLLYLSLTLDTWQLRRFDLTTQQDSMIAEISAEDWGDPGAGFQDLPSVRQLVCSSAHPSAYVLVNYQDEDGLGYDGSGYAKSHVVGIDIATQAITTLSASDTGESPRWIAEHIALANDSIVTVREINPVVPLTRVALTDGTRTDLTPDFVGGVALGAVPAYDRVYVATLAGVDQIDVSVPGKQNISPVGVNHPLAFVQPVSIGFDPANNRVVVGDSGLDALIAVDAGTGERSELISRKVGTGIALIAPRAFALSADASRAYIADDGDNAPARLFEVDLATGDRRLIGDISSAITGFVTGLALDEEGGRVFVSGHDVIVEVDLGSEDLQTIASTASTILEQIRGLALDIDSGRLLVGDPVADGILSLDLATHAVDVISQESVEGDGPGFGTVVSLTRVAGTTDLYVAGQTSETVTRVNLATGDREELATSCDLGTSSTFQTLDQVLHNASLDELVISGDRLYSLDLQTAECTTLPRRPDLALLQVQVTPANQILAVSFRGMLQIDRDTGQVVIVSK